MLNIGLFSLNDGAGCTSISIHLANYLAGGPDPVALVEKISGQRESEYKNINLRREADGTFMINNVRYYPADASTFAVEPIIITDIGLVNAAYKFDTYDKLYLCLNSKDVDRIPDILQFKLETGVDFDCVVFGGSKDQVSVYARSGLKAILISDKKEPRLDYNFALNLGPFLRIKGITPPEYHRDWEYAPVLFTGYVDPADLDPKKKKRDKKSKPEPVIKEEVIVPEETELNTLASVDKYAANPFGFDFAEDIPAPEADEIDITPEIDLSVVNEELGCETKEVPEDEEDDVNDLNELLDKFYSNNDDPEKEDKEPALSVRERFKRKKKQTEEEKAIARELELKAKKEAEEQAAESERLRQETERQQELKAEKEKAKKKQSEAEEEKQRAEKERQKAEEEKQRAEREKQNAEEEKRRAAEEKQKAEEERQKAERLRIELEAKLQMLQTKDDKETDELRKEIEGIKNYLTETLSGAELSKNISIELEKEKLAAEQKRLAVEADKAAAKRAAEEAAKIEAEERRLKAEAEKLALEKEMQDKANLSNAQAEAEMIKLKAKEEALREREQALREREGYLSNLENRRPEPVEYIPTRAERKRPDYGVFSTIPVSPSDQSILAQAIGIVNRDHKTLCNLFITTKADNLFIFSDMVAFGKKVSALKREIRNVDNIRHIVLTYNDPDKKPTVLSNGKSEDIYSLLASLDADLRANPYFTDDDIRAHRELTLFNEILCP